MEDIRRTISALLLCVVCAACSVTTRGSEIQYEYAESSVEEAQSEVAAAPTEFFVSKQDDRYAWERARYFLENYVGASAGSPVVAKAVGSRWGLLSAATSSAYTYEVWKDPVATGYNYAVACAPSATGAGDPSQAKLNAGNLSRFIVQGKLEVSLLGQR